MKRERASFSMPSPCGEGARRESNRAFTLIEIMLVVAIIGISMVIGYPHFVRAIHRQPLSQATQEVMEKCQLARQMAVIHGAPWELRVDPQDGGVHVEQVPADSSPGSNTVAAFLSDSGHGGDAAPATNSLFFAQISPEVHFDLVDVNFFDCLGASIPARVRFYPNGTSDEFTIIMSCQGEYRQVSTEAVTGLANVESDPTKFGREK